LNISFEEKISALYLCADILDYPTKDYFNKVNNLKKYVGFEVGSLDLEEVESEYISTFSIYASKKKCVPFASWWLDRKMSGALFVKIGDFYKSCGYVLDTDIVSKRLDHVSMIIVFIAILLEDKKYNEAREFNKFLSWLDEFSESLGKASKIKYFKFAVDIVIEIINSLKEDNCEYECKYNS